MDESEEVRENCEACLGLLLLFFPFCGWRDSRGGGEGEVGEAGKQ